MKQHISMQRAAWFVVAILWVLALLNYLDRQLIVTMAKPIKAELAIGDTRFGLFSSVFLWVYAACSPLGGFAADRFGRRRVILASVVIWSSATLWTGFASTFEWLLAARAVMGISEAFYLPAAVALIVEYHRGRTRAIATGLHLSGIYAGSILGGFGGWMAESFGWRLGFQLFGAFGIGYGLLLTMLLHDPPVPAESPDEPSSKEPPTLRETITSLVSSRSFVFLLCATTCVGTAGWTIRSWMPMFFNEDLGVDLARSGVYGVTVLSVANFIGMLVGGLLSDRWAMHNPRARLLIPAMGYLCAAPFFFGIGLLPVVSVVLGAVFVYGIAQGFLDSNLMPSLCMVADFRYRATGYGLLNMAGTLAGGAMTFIGGWLRENGIAFATIFQGISIVVLLIGVFLLVVKPKIGQIND